METKVSAPRGTRSDAVLQAFSAPTRTWFVQNFPGPTEAQARGWPAIAAGRHTLVIAPTGSGKTLATPRPPAPWVVRRGTLRCPVRPARHRGPAARGPP